MWYLHMMKRIGILFLISLFYFNSYPQIDRTNEFKLVRDKIDKFKIDTNSYFTKQYTIQKQLYNRWDYELDNGNIKSYIKIDSSINLILFDSIIFRNTYGLTNEIQLNKYKIKGNQLLIIDTSYIYYGDKLFYKYIHDSNSKIIEEMGFNQANGSYSKRFLPHPPKNIYFLKEYYCNGCIAREGNYKEGVGKLGIWRYYNLKGELILKGRHKTMGEQRAYDNYNFQNPYDTSCAIENHANSIGVKVVTPKDFFFRYGIWKSYETNKLKESSFYWKDKRKLRIK